MASEPVLGEDGYLRYFDEGMLHRDGGPAVIGPNGFEAWYQHGVLDCPTGPAVTFDDGSLHWYVEGTLDRLDGPACEWADPEVPNEYYIKGNPVAEEVFLDPVAKDSFITDVEISIATKLEETLDPSD